MKREQIEEIKLTGMKDYLKKVISKELYNAEIDIMDARTINGNETLSTFFCNIKSAKEHINNAECLMEEIKKLDILENINLVDED